MLQQMLVPGPLQASWGNAIAAGGGGRGVAGSGQVRLETALAALIKRAGDLAVVDLFLQQHYTHKGMRRGSK